MTQSRAVQVFEGNGNEDERFIYDRVSSWIAGSHVLTEADRPRLTVKATAFLQHALQRGLTKDD